MAKSHSVVGPDELKELNAGLNDMVAQLELKSGNPTKPNILEEQVVNLGITYVSRGQTFIPVPGAGYIWALTSIEDENGPGFHPEVNIGIEHPFDDQSVSAFEEKSLLTANKEKHRSIQETTLRGRNLSEQEIQEQLKSKSGQGHPTIADNAYVAGELRCSMERTSAGEPIWYLTDQSGRFSYKINAYSLSQYTRYIEEHSDKPIDRDQFINDKINEVLTPIAQYLERLLGIKICPKPYRDLKTKPEKIWDKAVNKKGQVMNLEQKDCWTLGKHAVHLLMKAFKQYCQEMGAEKPKNAPLYINAKEMLSQFNADKSLDRIILFLNDDTAKTELCGGIRELKDRLKSFVLFLEQQASSIKKKGFPDYLREITKSSHDHRFFSQSPRSASPISSPSSDSSLGDISPVLSSPSSESESSSPKSAELTSPTSDSDTDTLSSSPSPKSLEQELSRRATVILGMPGRAY